MNDTLYFLQGNRYYQTDYGLWKNDGTSSGTVLVAGWPLDVQSVASVNDTLYFFAYDYGSFENRAIDGQRESFENYEASGFELWKSDGTSSGRVKLKDMFVRMDPWQPFFLTNVNGTLYFRANDGTNGYELWKSDGTTAGTVLVKDIAAGSADSKLGSLTNVNGTLYFRAHDGANGYGLWKSDGTTAGTVLVKDVAAGSAGSNPNSLTNVNGTLYFQTNDGIFGEELWKTDGTEAGTVRVSNIADPGGSSPSELTVVGTTLFFVATTDEYGRELWALNLNEPPTAVALQNVTATLPENTSTTSAIPLADIVVTDDALGTHTLSLSGADAAFFEIVGSQLYLKAGTVLDFETQSTYAVTINVDDDTVGSTIDASVDYTLTLSNVPEHEIALFDDGVEILHNTSSVSFGNTPHGTSLTKTFTIRNVGTDAATLTLGNITLPAGFTLVTRPATTLAINASTTFQVRFDATNQGTFSGPLSLSSNDANENPFRFTIEGTVTGNSADVQIIDDGDTGFTTSSAWTTSHSGRGSDVRWAAAGTGTSLAT